MKVIIMCILLVVLGFCHSYRTSAQVIVPIDLSSDIPHANNHVPSAPDPNKYQPRLKPIEWTTGPIQEDASEMSGIELFSAMLRKNATEPYMNEEAFSPQSAEIYEESPYNREDASEMSGQELYSAMLRENAPKDVMNEQAFSPQSAKRYGTGLYNPLVDNEEINAKNQSHIWSYIAMILILGLLIVTIMIKLK